MSTSLNTFSAEVKETLLVEGVPLYVCGRGSSSLDVAWELLGRGDDEALFPVWSSLLLEAQTAGRGRMGRTWESPPGHIYAALRLPSAPPFDSPGASLALAVILAESLGELGWQSFIKWPNDLIYNGGKVGGILLENRRGALVAGIGLNLNEAPKGPWLQERDICAAPPPTALPWAEEPKKLWRALVKSVILLYKKKFKGPMATLVPHIEPRLLWQGQRVTVMKAASEPTAQTPDLTGTLVGLGADGQLKIRNELGVDYCVWSGTLICQN